MEEKNAIRQIEQGLDLAFRALLEGDVMALQGHADAVATLCQKLAVEPELKGGQQRSAIALGQAAQRLQSLREALIRHQVANELMLRQLVPAAAPSTYGAASSMGSVAASANPYAGVARASGRMERVLLA